MHIDDASTTSGQSSALRTRLSMRTLVNVEIEDARLQLIILLVDLDKKHTNKLKSHQNINSSRRKDVKYLPALDENAAFEGGYQNVLCQVSQVSWTFALA